MVDYNQSALFLRLIEGAEQFFRLRGQHTLLETYLPKALEASIKVGDKRSQANLLHRLGVLESRREHRPGSRHYDAALPLFQAERARLGEANLLKSLGDLERRLGNIDQARAHYDAALPLFQAERDRLGEANIYMSLADMFLANKDWLKARTYYEQALPLFVVERDPLGQANTLIDLGRARFELGDHDQGMQDVQQAAGLFRSVQTRTGHVAQSSISLKCDPG